MRKEERPEARAREGVRRRGAEVCEDKGWTIVRALIEWKKYEQDQAESGDYEYWRCSKKRAAGAKYK